jgi:hypothetical protein
MSLTHIDEMSKVTLCGPFQKQLLQEFNPVAMKDSLQKCQFDHYQMSRGLLSGAISHIHVVEQHDVPTLRHHLVDDRRPSGVGGEVGEGMFGVVGVVA